jgi:hypothetical protein
LAKEEHIRDAYNLKSNDDVSNTVTMFPRHLDAFYISIDDKVKWLPSYLQNRSVIREKKEVFDLDLTPYINRSLIVTISLTVGNIYYDKDFVPDALVGYFNAFHTFSSNPRLANPKKITTLFVDLHNSLKNNIITPNYFRNYLLGAKNRSEDRSSQKEYYFMFNAVDLKKPYYNYLKTIRVTDFKK